MFTLFLHDCYLSFDEKDPPKKGTNNYAKTYIPNDGQHYTQNCTNKLLQQLYQT